MSENPQRYKVLWAVLIIFIGLNIWLLYGKVNLQQQVNRLQAVNLQKAGIVSMTAEPIKFLGHELPAAKSFKMVAVFTDYGCGSCVISEIEYLNKWYQSYPNTLQVYYQGNTDDYLEGFDAEFEYQKIESANNLFNVAITFGNPVAAIVDVNNTVQALHTNDLIRPGSDRRRANFYNRVESLFESVYGEE